MATTVTPRTALSSLARRARALADSGEKPLAAIGAVIEAVPLAALVADDDGRYVLANAAAIQLTGYAARALRRLSVWDLTPAPNKHEFEVLWRAFIQQREQRGDYDLITKSGQVVPVEYAARANVLPHLHVSLLRVHERRARPRVARSAARV